MIDHAGFNVTDLERSIAFYTTALAPLGYRVKVRHASSVGFGTDTGTSVDPGGDFWLSEGQPQEPRVHIAFSAANEDEVRAFYAAALAAGGVDNGAPGLRPTYHPGYYAAFVLDPDGYNIEAVVHRSASLTSSA
jgi:catechol 2,3-dioxygenase-like lactoylglutathione lyase family enzyme